MHRRAGAALETRGEADPSELARHFVVAAGGGGDPRKAIDYSVRAGEAALARFAWESAIAHWETACRLMEEHDAEPGQLADLLERLETLIFNTGGDHAAVLRHLEHALALRQALGQELRVALIHSRLGRARSTHVGNTDYTQYMDFERALAHFRAAEPVLTSSGDSSALGWFYSGMASAAFNSVHVHEGEEACEAGMRISEQLDDPPLRSTLMLLKGGFLKLRGRFAEAMAAMRDAYELADRENYPLATFFAATNMADWTEGYHGGLGRLLEDELLKPRMASGPQRNGILTDLGRMWCRNGDLPRARAIAADLANPSLNAVIACCEGDMATAEHDISHSMEAMREVGQRSAYANRAHLLAELRLAGDDFEGAARLLGGELAIGIDGGSALVEVRAAAELAIACCHAGQLDEAGSLLARCVEVLASGECWGRKAGRVAVAQAVLAGFEGRCPDIETHMACALSTFRDLQLPWDEADAQIRGAEARDRCGKQKEAASARAAAAEIYRRIGAGEAWLRRATASAH
jgi:tetratricopeptide (TPR) repeat protein